MKHDDFLRIYIQKLNYFNYSPRTIEIYSHYASKFMEAVGKYPAHIISADFQGYLDSFSFTSVSQQNQVINAIQLPV